jgi:hypothetical protein
VWHHLSIALIEVLEQEVKPLLPIWKMKIQFQNSDMNLVFGTLPE